jgi:hypothetical protein
MKKYMIVAFALLVLTVSAGAWAQNSSAFKTKSITGEDFSTEGISMIPPTFTLTNLTYKVWLQPNAKLIAGAQTYTIESIFGFYAVGPNLAALGPNYTFDDHEWKFTDGGNTDGWTDNNKKNRILPGTDGGTNTPLVPGANSRVFTFSQLSFSQPPPLMGVHVRLLLNSGQSSPFAVDGDDGGITDGMTTGYIIPTEGGWNTYGAVPELPASSLYGLGSVVVVTYPAMLVWLRKRRA